MDGGNERRSLSFSIESILARDDRSSTTDAPHKYSPYADVSTVIPPSPCYGTEALDARLGHSSFSGDSADEDDCDADDSSVNTSPTSRSDATEMMTSSPEENIKQSQMLLKCKSKKKTRTVFSRQQVFYLEAAFDAKRYLSSAERSEIATSLNLSETQVKVWFQNRRNKWKAQINGDEKGSSAQDHGPIFLPPFLCSSVAAAAAAQAQRQQGGLPTLPFFRQPVFY